MMKWKKPNREGHKGTVFYAINCKFWDKYPLKNSQWSVLTYNHQSEFEALLHGFPVDLIGQVGKSHVSIYDLSSLGLWLVGRRRRSLVVTGVVVTSRATATTGGHDVAFLFLVSVSVLIRAIPLLLVGVVLPGRVSLRFVEECFSGFTARCKLRNIRQKSSTISKRGIFICHFHLKASCSGRNRWQKPMFAKSGSPERNFNSDHLVNVP